MNKDVVVNEQLVQYTCRGCFGEVWLRVPFAPHFCSHCGKEIRAKVEITIR
jgi:rRNA maturation endonuclease Nob1